MEKFSASSTSTTIDAYEYRTIAMNYTMPLVLFGCNNDEIVISVEKRLIISD